MLCNFKHPLLKLYKVISKYMPMKYPFMAVFILSVSTAYAFAEPPDKLVKKGNQAFFNGRYDDAMSLYDKALAEDPESPSIIYFNQGNTHYKKGDYSKAIELYERAALKTKDLGLQAKSYFNAGNAMVKESENNRGGGDLKKSIASLKEAVTNYQKALKTDPELKWAGHNIEVARLIMKQIRDDIKKQKEREKKEAEKQKETMESLKDIIKRQKILNEKISRQGSKGKNSLRKDGISQLSKEQERIKKDTLALSDAISSPNRKSAEEKIKKHLSEAAVNQDKAVKDLDAEDLKAAAEDEKHIQTELERALEAMSSKGKKDMQRADDKKGSHNKDNHGKSNNNGRARQTEHSGSNANTNRQGYNEDNKDVAIDKDARYIIEKEKRNREKRRIGKTLGIFSVDKDW